MSFLNYTNRINIICNDENNSDINIFASSQNNNYYVFQDNLERLRKEVKKNFPEIQFSEIKIFVEAYRDAYRKEVQWGDLENPVTDKIDFFKKKVLVSENIERNLDEIDSSTARFRVIMVNGEKNIATSEGFRPYVVKTKDEIHKVQVNVKSSLIGTYEKEMEELFYCDFHDEEPNMGQPVIYLNKKLGIKSDMNSDLRIRTLIFSFMSDRAESFRKSFAVSNSDSTAELVLMPPLLGRPLSSIWFFIVTISGIFSRAISVGL